MDDPVELDKHRGMMAQKATEERRTLSGDRADRAATAREREAFEDALVLAPPRNTQEAVERAIYVLRLYAETEGLSPVRERLAAGALDALEKMFGAAGANENLSPDGSADPPPR